MSQRSAYTPASSNSYSSFSRSMSGTPYSGMPGSNEMRGTDIIAEYLLNPDSPDGLASGCSCSAFSI